MITLKIDIDIDDAELTTLGRQVPFAMSNALNSSMIKAQTRVRGRIRALFTVRRVKFLELSTKITQFSKKTSLVAELAIAPPGDASNIYGKFEPGGEKKPRDGRHIAVPGKRFKPNKRTILKPEQRPRQLLAAPEAHDSGAFIRPAHGNHGPAIFVRRGKHLILAYNLENEVPIAPTLKFEETGVAEFTKVFPSEFDRELAKALASAR